MQAIVDDSSGRTASVTMEVAFAVDCRGYDNKGRLPLNANNENEGEEQKPVSGRSRFSKGNWIRKLGNYSPSKCQVPESPLRKNRMRAVDSGLCNTYEAVTLGKTSASPETSSDMPDLESIIRDFEMGYLSPSKQDAAMDRFKQKNFVKKIVEAFEVKYKVYNDLKTTQEAREYQESQKVTDQPKRRSGVFSSPFKSCSEESRRLGKLDDSANSKQSWEDARDANRRSGVFSSPSKYNSDNSNSCRRSGIFGTSFKIASGEDGDRGDSSKNIEDETKDEDRSSGIFSTPSKNQLEDSKSSRRSGIFSSPFNRSGSKDSDRSKSDIYMSPVHLDHRDAEDSGSDSSDIFKFDKDESDKKSNFHFSPLKMSSLDETKTLESIDLDVTLPQPEETIFLSGRGLPKTSTMINEFPKAETPRVSTIDRTPKIVGAFLKKPIEVEDTSIDWIPITGKKLPRKRSLKKLLSSLTGKKSLEKRSKLFSSQRNLTEESRELQDSGYDERSCSSSSLTSLVSFTEALLQQENSYAEPERRTTLRTFRSGHLTNEQEDEAFYDAYPVARKTNRKKLLLTEVPREEVKLELGPAYPTSKVLTMSLDRKMLTKKTRSPSPVYARLTKVPRHPNVSKIPKHPFVSLTKMDQHHSSNEPESVIVKNDLYEVEFRKSSKDISSSASARNSSSTLSHYDIPRKFLSKSDPEISQIYRSTGTEGQEEPIYDVPRTHAINRPRSSVYEEAVSLKRRSTNLAEHNSDFYPVSCALEFQYDTIKTRNCKAYFNRGAVHSDSDLVCMQRTSAF